MRKRFFQRNFFLKCLMVLLAIGWSTNAVWAETGVIWYQIRVKAIFAGGGAASSYVAVKGHYDSSTSAYTNPTTSDYTMAVSSSSYNHSTYGRHPDLDIKAIARNGETFIGWYLNEECTQLLTSKLSTEIASNSAINRYNSTGEVQVQTIYALFSAPSISWHNYGGTPAAGNYYIFGVGYYGFATVENGSVKGTKDPSKATLFTLTSGTTTTVSCVIDDQTKYLNQNGQGVEVTESPHSVTLESKTDNYMVHLDRSSYPYWEMETGGRTDYENKDESSYTLRWLFIPEATYKSFWKVKSVAENGTVTINASPNASGTAYVKFNVSTVSPLDAFDCELTGGDGHWVKGTPTCADSVITVPVTYTAQNVHSGTETPISTATVTLTAKNDAATHASATATAYVDLQPTFTMAVNELNWSAKPAGEEVYNVGMEVAASQRERLQNKLVYSTANAIAQNNATWTATIIGEEGDNPEQFKFKNGTRTVTFSPYSADSLDVIYAPTAPSGEGSHSAKLHIEVSYTDANATPKTLTCVKEVALSGKAQDVPMLTMALNGSETASNSESLDFGNIVGTISKTVIVDLYNHGLTNLTKAWVTNAEGVFEFDVNTIDLSKANQRFVIYAHRSTPITTEYEDYEATLTISGEDSNGDPVSATLTLSYRALPLVKTTITWNWELLNEDATYTNPLSTNSDGEWTLDQRDGNGGMTYDAVTRTITTEYMHHESGYTATFELTIPQTDSCTALTDTLYATIKDTIPPVIEINTQANFDEYVVEPTQKQYITFNDEEDYLQFTTMDVYLKWSGQSYFTCDFASSTGSGSYKQWLYEVYSDGTEKLVAEKYFYHNQSYAYPVSSHAVKLRIHGSNIYKNVRYFEYDTIKVDKQSVQFVGSVDDPINVTAEFANKRAVTISLNAAAQEFFELRATGKPTGSSLVYNNADGMGVHKVVKDKVFKVAFKDGVTYADAQAAATNGFQVILKDNYTYNSETVILPIVLDNEYKVTYLHDEHGSYNVTYHDDMETHHPVAGTDYEHTVTLIAEANCTATLSEPTPASGYMFRGWKLNGTLVSCKANYTLIPASGATVEPVFVPAEEAVYGIDDARFADLDEALSTAGSLAESKPVVVLLKDVTLSEPATHTIPAGVTLLIPHKADYAALQTTPDIVTTENVLSAYRTLTLKEGVNIVVNGNICVGGKIMAAGGGSKSAYTTGECGVINMATGGHIELNDGAQLYCWGYIKGQDMDQGNNTQGTGTVTVNSGAIVHENFELGDWRGGTASSDIYYKKDDNHLFPFQSYALQNVEVPTTYKFGSKLETFMAVNTGFGSIPFAVSMIGSLNTLFLLQDEGSVIRKWYDPTTDLTCYELSGTAQLDQLVMNLPFVGNFESGDCNLPISNSMHIILKDDLTLSKRLMQQAGSIIEIKSTATINLDNELYMYDKDQWGKHIHDFYFRSFNNLTSHKDRGDEKSKDGLEDAKFIVDGVLNVRNGGKLYATEGGANIMGNGGGEIHFMNALPSPTVLWAVDTIKGAPYIKWVSKDVKAANLCNEDGSYTKSSQTTYYNVHGRWFYEDKKDEQPDHTYDFYYLDNGNAGEEEFASAVYSHDKTGLEARMKWFNVVRTADNCTDVEDDLEKPFTSNWWIDTLATTTTYYNYTMLNDWHQFIQTQDDEHVYSGSNNTLYQKDGCAWTEAGVVDENCLYTFEEGGNLIKKALVNGEFIALTSNGYDPAYYHEENEVKTYYICFQGCNWHPATPYDGESKAYTIHPEDEDLHYIWFNGDWMNVQRDEPFFYTEDEQTNVRTYYEYVNGDWIVATPYVSVSDAIDPEPNPRTFYMIKEAFNVASIKKDATIKLLRDIPNMTEVLTYTTQNTTCTLDLNGHILSGNIANLITVNAPGATFTITDNTGLKLGKISNAASKAVYVQKGTLVVANGTIESSAAYAIEGAATTAININGGYFAATSKCVNVLGSCTISGGHFTDNTNLATYAADHKYPFETTDMKYRWEVSAAWQITFKNGETVLQTLHLHPGETPVYSGNEPYNDNQKFTGWDPAIEAATADATYQAQFEAIGENKSRVTLNSNGGNEGLQYVFVTTGSAIGTLPEGTTKDGHTFAGWWTTANGGTQMTVETPISDDVIYFAHYNKNSYTLTWEANGGDLSGTYTSGTVAYGTAITAPTATKDGCEFLGWIPALSSTMPGANTTYTAQWTIPYTVKHRQQNLNDDGYTEITADRQISSAAAGSYVTPAVKTYDGFMSPTAQPVLITANAEDNVITYDYARRTYTIMLNANGGECAATSLEVKHGAAPVLPAATKEGRVFEGWFTKAVGGDRITTETVIQRNIGTLYAQFSEANMDVTTPLIISDTREVTDLRITTTGSLNITGDVTATNFILESNGSTASGQFVAGYENLHYTHAYFDLKLNAKNHQWYAVAVPWPVNAETGISVNGRTLELGKDFDIIYYNGTRRAEYGKQKCWSYVEDDVDKTLVPGRLYMIGLMSDAATVRFEKTTGDLLTTSTSVTAYASGVATDAGWNGVANPALFHAFVNPGVTEGQVYVPDQKRYETVTLNTTKFVVGEGAFVQVNADKAITVTKDGAFAAPRRTRAQANVTYDVRIAPAEGTYTDRLFIKTTDSKEADTYTVGEDLAKVGVSSIVPQMWVNRYDAKLCVNTAELTNETAEYPLGISVPANGEYTISIQDAEVSDQYSVYLTLNNEAIWNLSDAPYTLDLTKGTTNTYGLRISAKAPQVVTGVDEAVVDAKGETRKVLINNQVFIIRGNEVYTIDGQLVK